MEYYEISVPDRNDSVMRVNLDGTYYYLRVTWNAYGEFWMLSIYDADMQMKIGMAKLVPGAIWNFYYLNSNGPPGILGVQTDKETSVYKGYKQDKIEMRGDRAEMSDFPLYLNTVAGGLDRRDQTIGGFSFVVKIYALPVVEIIG